VVVIEGRSLQVTVGSLVGVALDRSQTHPPPGWYFTGRRRVLGELSAWLSNTEDIRSRIITGRPGSGKSAILAEIVTLSDPEYRRKALHHHPGFAQLIQEGSIDLAVHAKGKTLQDVTRRLADSLGVEAQESAVLANFFVSLVLVLFLFVHVLMVCLAGFWSRTGAMITGRTGSRKEHI